VAGASLPTFDHVSYESAMCGRHSSKPPNAPDASEQVHSQRPLTTEQINEVIAESWATAGAEGLEPKPKAKN
jgi:hypothetical protein